MKKSGRKQDDAVSEIIGTVLLISIVVLAGSIIAVTVLSQPQPQKIPSVSMLISVQNQTVSIKHDGGDPLINGTYIIRVNANDVTSGFAPPALWSIGQTLTYTLPGVTLPSDVEIEYVGSTSAVTVASSSFGPQAPRTITSSAGANGGISPLGIVTVDFDGSQTYTITPNTGYYISGVVVDGVSVGAPATYTFTHVRGAHFITASFLLLPGFSSISPAVGPTGGSQTVNIAGYGFTGATSVTFGGTAGTSLIVSNDTSITVTTPSHLAGAVDVVITTPGGSATGTGAYTYYAAPTFVSISPSSGPLEGGQSVTITGTNFVTGATTVTINGTAATSVSVSDSSHLTATTPSGIAGTVNVVVTTPGGSATGTGAYTYYAAPTFVSISPSSGPLGGGQSVTITGTNFVTGATTVTINGTAATSVSVSDSSHLTATTPSGIAGTVNVVVTTPGGSATGTGAYTYYAAPTFVSISPSSGPLGGGQSVTITGTNFVTGATTVTINGTAATSVSVSDSSHLTATTPSGIAGTVNVVVTTPGGSATGTGAYTYYAAPTFVSISPSSGPVTAGTYVTITGTNFVTGSTTVTIGGASATSVSVSDSGHLTAYAPSGSAGAVDVVITTPGGSATGTGAYTYYAAPTFVSISPKTGPLGGGQSVTITGTNFVSGATSVQIGTGTVPAASVTYISSSSISLNTPSGSAGTVSVTVTTPGGSATGTNVYTYLAAPTFGTITPATGLSTAQTSVTITGTGFDTIGTTTVSIGGQPATSVSVTNSGSLTATTPVSPSAGATVGAANVVITTNGGSGTGTGAYDYYITDSFYSSQSVTVPSTISGGNPNIDYLVVGGGGGGGRYGGGGGAGGVLTGTLTTVLPGSQTVTVGAAGTGSTSSSTQGGSGGSSSFASVSVSGGGGGGSAGATASAPGVAGGSGGGGTRSTSTTGGAPVSGQGNYGGGGAGTTATTYFGGGGGGKSGTGSGASGTTPGTGGAGYTSSLAGVTVAGGGGGGGYRGSGGATGGTGGSGGGGAGGLGTTAGSGASSQGSGGGGGGNNANGGAGFGGMVFLKFY